MKSATLNRWLLSCLMLGTTNKMCMWYNASAYSSELVTRRKAFDIAASHALVHSFSMLSSPAPSCGADFDTDARIELAMETRKGKSYPISIPRIGYSLYKTSAEEVPLCMELALQAGVQHFDVASQYGTNEEVGMALKSFIQNGVEYVPDPAPSKFERRKRLFVTHKVSNAEQSNDKAQVKKAVKEQMKKLRLDYLDMCSIHSPLTDSMRRLATYDALLELQSDGIVRSVGVCNYGINPLRKFASEELLSF